MDGPKQAVFLRLIFLVDFVKRFSILNRFISHFFTFLMFLNQLLKFSEDFGGLGKSRTSVQPFTNPGPYQGSPHDYTCFQQ